MVGRHPLRALSGATAGAQLSMSQPWLITGANGQLGWELTRQAEAGAVVACDRSALDITVLEGVRAIIAHHQPTLVINAAAYTAVDRAEDDESTAFKVNRDGPAHLASVCAGAGIPLIHISTDYVFDGTKAGPYVEQDPTAPLGIYGASKLAGEEALRAAGANHVTLRTAWVYGNHGHNFVKTMLRLGQSKEELSVVNDQTGCPTYAADLAAVVLEVGRQLVTAPAPEKYGTFHITNSGETTWHGFADAIFEAMKSHSGTRPVLHAIATQDYPTPAKRPKNSVLDCTKLHRVYGLTPRPWQAALAEMLGREFENAKD